MLPIFMLGGLKFQLQLKDRRIGIMSLMNRRLQIIRHFWTVMLSIDLLLDTRLALVILQYSVHDADMDIQTQDGNPIVQMPIHPKNHQSSFGNFISFLSRLVIMHLIPNITLHCSLFFLMCSLKKFIFLTKKCTSSRKVPHVIMFRISKQKISVECILS